MKVPRLSPERGLNEIAVVLDTGRNIAESDQTNNLAFMRIVVKDGQIKEIQFRDKIETQ